MMVTGVCVMVSVSKAGSVNFWIWSDSKQFAWSHLWIAPSRYSPNFFSAYLFFFFYPFLFCSLYFSVAVENRTLTAPLSSLAVLQTLSEDLQYVYHWRPLNICVLQKGPGHYCKWGLLAPVLCRKSPCLNNRLSERNSEWEKRRRRGWQRWRGVCTEVIMCLWKALDNRGTGGKQWWI